MSTNQNNLSRSEKILLFLYEFGNGKRMRVRFEDIVVGIYKKYPQDFHLKGYKEYPDSGDLVHKPLYDFKKKGYLTAANKIFSLTDRGVEFARQLSGQDKGMDVQKNGDRLSRSSSVEFNRIKALEGFSLYVQGKSTELSENDFYNYFAVSVRSSKNTFIGRMETINATIAELSQNHSDVLYESIIKYHHLLVDRYKNLMDFFTK